MLYTCTYTSNVIVAYNYCKCRYMYVPCIIIIACTATRACVQFLQLNPNLLFNKTCFLISIHNYT